MNEFMEIEMRFDRSLHTKFFKIWFFIHTIDSLMYI